MYVFCFSKPAFSQQMFSIHQPKKNSFGAVIYSESIYLS